MSRSYREPVYVQGYGSTLKPLMKRLASKAVRHTDDLANGNAYRRVYPQHYICDHKLYAPSVTEIIRLSNGHRIIQLDTKPYHK